MKFIPKTIDCPTICTKTLDTVFKFKKFRFLFDHFLAVCCDELLQAEEGASKKNENLIFIISI